MAQLMFRQAVAAGIAQEMKRDPTVYVIGEDVSAAGGSSRQPLGCSSNSGPSASATPRSLSRRSLVRPWVRL